MDREVIRNASFAGPSAERASRSVILASFLSSVAFNFVFPLLPLYVHELVGPGSATVLWSGLALAATPMAGAVTSPFWGRLADRFGYRPMLLRALGSTTVLIGLMAFPNAPWQLVALRALAGGFGSFQAAAMGALASWSRAEDLSMAIGRLQMAQVFGAIVGPLAGGTVAALFGVRSAALAGGVVLGLGTILVARWFHEPKSRRAAPRGAEVRLRPTVLWLPIITLLAVQFTDASFNPILPLLLAQSGEGTGMVAGLSGLAASFSAAAAAVGSGLAGQLLKRRVRRRAVMLPAAGVAALALLALVAPLPWGVVGIRVLCGGIISGVAVASYSLGGLAVSPGQRGSAYGWLSSSSQAGFAASPIVTGMLSAIDLRAVLVLDAGLCLVAALGWGLSPRIARAPDPALSASPALPAPRLEKSAAPAEAAEGR